MQESGFTENNLGPFLFEYGDKKLKRLHLLRWPLFLAMLAMISLGIHQALADFTVWGNVIHMFLIMAIFYGLSALVRFAVTDSEAWVSAYNDLWRIGNYSEGELRKIAEEAFEDLPTHHQKIIIHISRNKGTNAFTFLSRILPGFNLNKRIVLTSGCLHYLDPGELKAILLHENAHHHGKHHCIIPGGWLAADLSFFSILLSISASPYSFWSLFTCFLVYRLIACWIPVLLWKEVCYAIEHRCDLFSAERIGSATMINALLKIGEEAELKEIIWERTARNLSRIQYFDHEEMESAFDKVRPCGRIFHDNLFRHSREFIKELCEDDLDHEGTCVEKPFVDDKVREFLDNRRKRPRNRIRWRKYDRQGKGKLSPDEINELCMALRANPEHMLVDYLEERQRSTHPAFRDRILFLHSRISR